ncbi:MAG: phosphoribulokinase [Sulfitobacter sp.]
MKIDDILAQIQAVPLRNGRRIIAIAGAPASGKSTLSDVLARRIPNAYVIPMDGFHRDNVDLEKHGLLARKGAPETFDVTGFIQIIQAVRVEKTMSFPTFDRTNDCVVPTGGQLPASAETIIVEGNYLLLNVAPWNELAKEWDLSLMVDVPLPVLQERLVARWLQHGHDAESALARAQSNDIPNAQTVIDKSAPADLMIDGTLV